MRGRAPNGAEDRMPVDIQVEFSEAGLRSATSAALFYAGVRTFARLLTTLVPQSAIVALVAALLWLAAAAWLFVVVTWQRDDNWLAAGLVIGVSLLTGGLVSDFLSALIDTSSLVTAVVATAVAFLGLFVKSVVLVPLSGGFVFGARWLTSEIRRTDVFSS
jgi:ABC-type multidrug transport system permease subunit